MFLSKAMMAILVVLGTVQTASAAGPQLVKPTEVWPDDRGQHIQAHGGGIIKHEGTYYWFGEYRGQDLERGRRAVGCYASPDLVNWTFKGLPFEAQTLPEFGEVAVLERPKVYHNAKTKKFVMYMHLDDRSYKAARVGVATSDTPAGPYQFVKSFRPLGHESRDIGQFIDDDGTAYLIFEDRPNGFHIAKLSDDYLDVIEDTCLVKERIEGGALVKYEGLYYMVGSALTGWNPNPNKYATSKSLAGPWSAWKDIAPPETKTYGSQSTMLFKVVGSETTSVVFMGDIWRPRDQWNSRYLWMPVEIGDGKLALPKPHPWTLDVTTGKSEIRQDLPAPPALPPQPPPASRPASRPTSSTAPTSQGP